MPEYGYTEMGHIMKSPVLLVIITIPLLCADMYGFTPDTNGTAYSVTAFIAGGGGRLERLIYGDGYNLNAVVAGYADYSAGAELTLKKLVAGVKAGGYTISGFTQVIKDRYGTVIKERQFSSGNGRYLAFYGGLRAKYGSFLIGGFLPREQTQIPAGGDTIDENALRIIYDNRWLVSMRLGREDGFFVTGEWFNSNPLISGGAITLGAGYMLLPQHEASFWCGISLKVISKIPVIFRISGRVYHSYYVSLTGGYSGADHDSMISLSLSRKFHF